MRGEDEKGDGTTPRDRVKNWGRRNFVGGTNFASTAGKRFLEKGGRTEDQQAQDP